MDSQKNNLDKLMQILGVITNVALAFLAVSLLGLFIFNLLR